MDHISEGTSEQSGLFKSKVTDTLGRAISADEGLTLPGKRKKVVDSHMPCRRAMALRLSLARKESANNVEFCVSMHQQTKMFIDSSPRHLLSVII